jgi:hypothetical protein
MGIHLSEGRSVLSLAECRAIRIVAVAGDGFEPFVERLIKAEMLERLIAKGLVERGASCKPSVGPTGARLTADGWRLIENPNSKARLFREAEAQPRMMVS